ncbi:MAG: ornithine carbamoyltransferase [Nitrososphaerota archaeon]|nr:ornithine carbamoyltransferase [Nitrososphaerota archaeon]MDG6926904.1 ornithine carbamoyltransferase [Nitrososphaerota archaeon]MDG6929978.1 ornithine carbamoyltransferase [Nitrososphaerota archaeon]MDG6931929.1 ornithine carbamoyltransferase [Nitrososphaerota archaeon]MDG6943868.1 ornithine carbamoyltransferase [Nitrososphaerota archaeon]
MADYLSVTDFSSEEMEELWSMTDRLKANPLNNLLNGKNVLLLFEKPSTRTRVSFEVGVNQLGGSPIYMDASTSQLSRGEPVEDTGRTLDRYVDMVVARVYKHEDLVKLALSMEKPVINALSDLEHPCQIMADLYTIREKLGGIKGKKITFIGDGSNNVCTSLILGSALAGASIVVASPPGYEPKKAVVGMASELSANSVKVTGDPVSAVSDADVIYTDVFTSMGQEKEREQRLATFLPKYQVNQQLMKAAPEGSLFMHCLPAHHGEEVTREVLYGSHSVVFDQAENRLHVQKAIMLKLFNRKV